MGALAIIKLVTELGLPLALKLIESWKNPKSDDPTPDEWIALLKQHHSLTKTYDQQIADAETRAKK